MVRIVFLLSLCGTAFACDYPDEGNMPLRRAIAQVKYLPETEAWAAARHEDGAVVHYALHLDRPKRAQGRCYWRVEVRAGKELWRIFYVRPDGKEVLEK